MLEISWLAANGPVALVSVKDQVCIDCNDLLKLDDTDSKFKDLMDTAIIDDIGTQQWNVSVWGSPVDRCFSSSNSNNCEVMTAKVSRTWSSF